MKRSSPVGVRSVPQLNSKAADLAAYLKTLPTGDIARYMNLSLALASKTHDIMAAWGAGSQRLSPAVDCFVGDIYSGLRASDFSGADSEFAQDNLRILSGLYGVLRPYDGIMPYRLEMAYKLPASPYDNLYTYWGDDIVRLLPKSGPLLNVSSLEYMKTILPFVNPSRVVTPQFLTVNPKTGEPTFVVVHAKIARGAMARWAIKNQIRRVDELTGFFDLGYRYNASMSTPNVPVYICERFEGIGLSVRLDRRQ